SGPDPFRPAEPHRPGAIEPLECAEIQSQSVLRSHPGPEPPPLRAHRQCRPSQSPEPSLRPQPGAEEPSNLPFAPMPCSLRTPRDARPPPCPEPQSRPPPPSPPRELPPKLSPWRTTVFRAPSFLSQNPAHTNP